MSRTNLINTILIIIILASSVLLLALVIAQKNYSKDMLAIETKLQEKTISKYFTGDGENTVESTYRVGISDEPVVYNKICNDCDDTLTNMHNRESMIVVTAPDEYCDLDIEYCIIYVFDPFGLGIYKREELIRSAK